jgi:hypothetical protein
MHRAAGLRLLAIVAFLNALKPSEPHLVPYLVNVKALSEHEVRGDHWVVVPLQYVATASSP